MKKIIGMMMIASVFIGIFIMAAITLSLTEAILIFAGIAGLGIFLVIAVDLILS